MKLKDLIKLPPDKSTDVMMLGVYANMTNMKNGGFNRALKEIGDIEVEDGLIYNYGYNIGYTDGLKGKKKQSG